VGHRAVIGAAVRAARQSGGTAAILTFRPHPSALFRPDQPTRMILDDVTQKELFGDLGIAAVITQPFTFEFASTDAAQFIPWLKQRLPHLAAVYVGENWRFGAGGRGDVAVLAESGRKAQIGVFSSPPVEIGGEPVTSTRIRGFLQSGEIAAANTLLGYSYFARGTVIPGKRLGRTLGFPTLNLAWAPELRPRFGVYQVVISGPRAVASLAGVANYGVRPTVESAAAPLLETHILGSCPFGEGDSIKVDWLRFLRPELKFQSAEELREQIARDVAAARLG